MNDFVTFEIIEYEDNTFRVETKHMAYHFRDELKQECNAKDLYRVMQKIADIMNNKYKKGVVFTIA